MTRSDDDTSSKSRLSYPSVLKYYLRSFVLWFDSLFLGKVASILLPNGKKVKIIRGSRDPQWLQYAVTNEIGVYWSEHQPKAGEVHLDIGANLGAYSLLATTSGAQVYAFEPDKNNQKLLARNMRKNGLSVQIVGQGLWNKHAFLPWRSHSAMSSLQGIGMLPENLPFLDRIEVDTLDRFISTLNLTQIDVIKMDIEGAEIEAIEGAAHTIKTYKPLLLIEAYHVRDGNSTHDRVVALLTGFGIPAACMRTTAEKMLVVEGY